MSNIINNIFNQKKMESRINEHDEKFEDLIDKTALNKWIDKLEKDELRDEKKNYLKFYDIILKELLGYETDDVEFEEDNGKEGRPVEFTLKKDDKPYAVIEVKGTTYKDLSKRYGNSQSPVEQVTNYASAKGEIKWAIVTNYDEFRFFNPFARDKYISFKFRQLKDENILKQFLLIFSKYSLIEKEIPKKLLNDTHLIERDLEDEFYELYSETRSMLIKEIEFTSEDIDRIEAIRLSQLILNRYIFLCFAEDLHLIEEETTTDILTNPLINKTLSETHSMMWRSLNDLFIFAKEGNPERNILNFNGGLFEEELSNLKIRDKIFDLNFYDDCYKEWKFEEKYEEIEEKLGVYKDTVNPIYKNLLIISSFDFGSEVDVNILGHIFEHSIGDIEELKDDDREQRQNDGIFYTPPYITEYICRNTIIPYLSKSGEANTVEQLISEYNLSSSELDKLDEKLKNIKIVDPACGSGAFLNKATDVLLDIHEYFHSVRYANSAGKLDQWFDSVENRRQILHNNIYGVDLNEESVEITKLSLFLKLSTTSGIKQGFKLPNLDKNIKCGNSLVSDKNIDDKAFNWREEFKEIFNNGGFDIIVGNPPYIKEKKNKKAFTPIKNSKYYQGKMDIWTFFGSIALDLIKDDGLISFIAPNNWVTNAGASKFRNKVNDEAKFEKYIDFGNYKVFDDAEIQTMIYIMKKNSENISYSFDYRKILNDKLTREEVNNLLYITGDNNNFTQFKTLFDRNINKDEYFNFNEKDIANILNKLPNKNVIYLKDSEISQGIVPNPDKVNSRNIKKIDNLTIEKYNITVGDNVFVFPRGYLENLTDFEKEFLKPTYEPTDMGKYRFPYTYSNELLYLTPLNTKNIDLSSIKNLISHLTPYFDIMEDRRENKKGSRENYHLHWQRDEQFFDVGEKILCVRKCDKPTFIYTTEKAYVQLSFNIIKTERISLKYLTGILNSNIIEFWLKYKGKMQGNNYQIDAEPLTKIPIRYEKNNLNKLIENITEDIIGYNSNLSEEIYKFNKWINRTIPTNLNIGIEYYNLTYDEFLLELKNQGANINSRDMQELIEEEFNKSINLIKPLLNKIMESEKLLNKYVYELYNLNPKDIEIIEKNLNN